MSWWIYPNQRGQTCKQFPTLLQGELQKNPKTVHLDINRQILSTSEPPCYRNCEFHHLKSAGRTQARENPKIIKVGEDLQDCPVQPKTRGTKPNHAKALTGLKVLLQPSKTWGQQGKSSYKVIVMNLIRGKKL